MPGPSTTKQMAADLEAELAAMEAEEEAGAGPEEEKTGPACRGQKGRGSSSSSSGGGTESRGFHEEGGEAVSGRAMRGPVRGRRRRRMERRTWMKWHR